MSVILFKVVDIRDEVSDIDDEVSYISNDVEVLVAQQLLQDERILTLEQDSDQLQDDVEGLFLCLFLCVPLQSCPFWL